jgi:hypothetical protein
MSELRRRLTSRDSASERLSSSFSPEKSARRADVAYPRVRAHCASLEELCHCLPGKRTREKEALRDVTAPLTQEIQLLDRLDPLRDDTLT